MYAADFKSKSRRNDTHESTTDADAQLYRKGNMASEPRYIGHTLSDNRHGLIASAVVTQADGFAERELAKIMMMDAKQVAHEQAQITLSADKGDAAAKFIEALTGPVLPHVAQNTANRKSAVPEQIASSDGDVLSQQKRQFIVTMTDKP